jgi:hypothetical protein
VIGFASGAGASRPSFPAGDGLIGENPLGQIAVPDSVPPGGGGTLTTTSRTLNLPSPGARKLIAWGAILATITAVVVLLVLLLSDGSDDGGAAQASGGEPSASSALATAPPAPPAPPETARAAGQDPAPSAAAPDPAQPPAPDGSSGDAGDLAPDPGEAAPRKPAIGPRTQPGTRGGVEGTRGPSGSSTKKPKGVDLGY